jgi:uncharacterized repeat protein (TIGR03803 family)
MKCLLVLVVLSQLTFAQTYTHKTLYNFGVSSKDGVGPYSSLVMDKTGNLYGTTYSGGGSTACSGGCGTVFKVTAKGKETILHAFVSTDGANPMTGLAIDSANNLYGLTYAGGVAQAGTAFKITAAGKFSVLHQFGRTLTDGLAPTGPLILDTAGNLYGMTYGGGTVNAGTVFKLSPKGVETILHNFSYTQPEGANPIGNLIRDSSGNLYGTTTTGGVNDQGIFFSLSATTVETILYSFCSQTDCADGGQPSYIVRDSTGNFFGETLGAGIVYQLTPQGVETPLFSFCLPGGIECADGGSGYGPLTLSNEMLYGTGNENGTNQVAYSMTTAGSEQDIYDFETFSNGTQPFGGMILGPGGNLFGTTYTGGTHGSGTVFELIKN